MKFEVRTSLVTAAIAFSQCTMAESNTVSLEPEHKILEEVFIVGDKDNYRVLAGSGTLIDSEAIAEFDATDINDLMVQVPGVYIRYEDGYGLRPNIGVRGVTSDRSQKITLMEDGILISPAPYTAPAAYYFPNINRMAALELVKGPSAIQHGPHTIGGALNMVTEAVPKQEKAIVGLTYGSDNYQKARVFYGDSSEQWGYWVDGLRYSADGFKNLDGGGNTGFERNDINAKLQWNSARDAKYTQSLAIKIGYADEDSNETYLGLTDEDFAASPTRRYAASQLDNFVSDHQQIHILHSIEFNNGIELFTRAYNQTFARAWNKFDGFIPEGSNAPLPAQSVLSDPDLFPEHIGVLRGDLDSNGNTALLIDVTNNDREYGSHGLAVDAQYTITTGDIKHELIAGVRFHHDYVERHHKVYGYFMEQGALVFDGENDRTPKALNEASSDALSVFIQNTMEVKDWKINFGLRYETIDGEFDNALDGNITKRSQDVIAPGVGVHYQVNESLGVLAGVYKGYSPAGPSSDESVDPEEAYNYEYGLRYQYNDFQTDLIGFFSDYSNYIGRCRASDSGCIVGDEFNGGELQVSGIELTSGYVFPLLGHLTMPIDLTYTYTDSAFQNSFESGFSQWGNVIEGDNLPYLPQNQVRLGFGLESTHWSLTFAAKFIDAMFESPAQGAKQAGDYVPAYTTYDISANWELSDRLSVKLIGENLSDKQVIVARRPFGARPNQPRSVKAGVTYAF